MDTTLLSALDTDGSDKFESAMNALQGDVSAAAARLSVDPRLRLEYSKRIKEMSADLRAKAERLKSEGKTLNELVAKKAKALFGPQANFNSLSEIQKNQIYAGIVESAGKSNPQVNMKMMQLSRIGRGLIVLSIAISVYEIYTADDKVSESGRQIAINGAGIAGAAAGGAMAGLMCGPGAPVCVLIGGFVGGALAAWEMGRLWN